MKPTRRQVLGTLVSAPLALDACRHRSRAQYTGTMVGASDRVGHRLRGPIATGPSRGEIRVPIVIVGAGPSGLSAAWRLQRSGVHDFVVLDLEPESGGTSRSGRNRVSAYPWGAHYIPTPMRENRALIALLEEMGIVEGRDAEGRPVVGEQYLVRDPDERIFANGAWHDGLYLTEGATHDDLAQRARFQSEIDRWVAFRDDRGRRAFAIPMANASDAPECTALDRISMAAWMDAHGFHSSRLRWLVDYACRDDYGLHMDQTSAWAGIFYFASRVERPGVPAQELIAWPEGNGHLVAHLVRGLDARLRTGELVVDVRDDGNEVVVTTVSAEANAPQTIHAEQVILATPAFVSARVFHGWRDRVPDHIAAFSYAPWMVANLTLRDRPRENGSEMAWDNVLRDSVSLGYVCATHQTLRDDGPTVLTYYLPFTGPDVRRERERLLGMDWQRCATFALDDLSHAHPDLDTLVEHIDVCRWGHGMVRPTVNFVWGGARAHAAEPITPRVIPAHSDLSGVALFEEAQYRGVRAAETVLRARGIAIETLLGA